MRVAVLALGATTAAAAGSPQVGAHKSLIDAGTDVAALNHRMLTLCEWDGFVSASYSGNGEWTGTELAFYNQAGELIGAGNQDQICIHKGTCVTAHFTFSRVQVELEFKVATEAEEAAVVVGAQTWDDLDHYYTICHGTEDEVTIDVWDSAPIGVPGDEDTAYEFEAVEAASYSYEEVESYSYSYSYEEVESYSYEFEEVDQSFSYSFAPTAPTPMPTLEGINREFKLEFYVEICPSTFVLADGSPRFETIKDLDQSPEQKVAIEYALRNSAEYLADADIYGTSFQNFFYNPKCVAESGGSRKLAETDPNSPAFRRALSEGSPAEVPTEATGDATAIASDQFSGSRVQNEVNEDLSAAVDDGSFCDLYSSALVAQGKPSVPDCSIVSVVAEFIEEGEPVVETPKPTTTLDVGYYPDIEELITGVCTMKMLNFGHRFSVGFCTYD